MAGSGDVSAGRLVGELVIDTEGAEEQLAQFAQQAEAESTAGGQSGRKRAKDVQGTGKDATPVSAKIDAKAKVALEGSISKDVQAALNETAFELKLNAAHLRQQIEIALNKPFDIVVNATIHGAAEGQFGLGTTPRGAPTPPPQELIDAMMVREKVKGRDVTKPGSYIGGIDAIYRNLNEALERAGKQRIGTYSSEPGNQIEKAAELMDKFGDKVENWVTYTGTGARAKPSGGTMMEFAQEQGIQNDPAIQTLTGASIGSMSGAHRRSREIFFAKLTEWAKTRAGTGGGVVNPVTHTPPGETQPPPRNEPPKVTLTAEQEEEATRRQTQIDALMQQSAEATKNAIATAQAGLGTRSVDVSPFATGPLDKSGRRGRGTGKEIPPFEPSVGAHSYYQMSEGEMGELAEHPGFQAWLAANPELDPRNNPPTTTLRERGRARQKELAGDESVAAQVESGLIDRALKKPRRQRGAPQTGPTPSTEMQDIGRVRQGPPSPLGEGMTEAPAVPREEKLRTEKLLNDWMANKGLRARGEVIAPAGTNTQIDLEDYLRAAEAGQFEDVYEEFQPTEVKTKAGKTRTIQQSVGFNQLVPHNADEERELKRLRGMQMRRPREIGGVMRQRLDPMEAMIRTIIRDVTSKFEETDEQGNVRPAENMTEMNEAIRGELEPRATQLRASLEQGTRTAATAQPGQRLSSDMDPARMIATLHEVTDFVASEITKLSEWIGDAEKEMKGSKGGRRKDLQAKIDRWSGFRSERQEQLTELEGMRSEIEDRGILPQEMILRRRANPEAAAAADADQARQQRARDAARVIRDKNLDVVGKQVGLSDYEKNFSELGTGGALSGQARGRLYKLMSTPGVDQAPPQQDVMDMLAERFLESPERNVMEGGRIEGGQDVLRRMAFGVTGKPKQKFTARDPGGVLGDLMSRLPEDTPKAQVQIVREGIRDALNAFIADQGARRGLANEAANRKENLATAPRNRTMKDLLAGLSGKGEFSLGGPGLIETAEADIETEKRRRAREKELPGLIRRARSPAKKMELRTELERLSDPEWTKRTPLEDVTKVSDITPGGGGGQLETTPGLLSRLETLKAIRANAGPEIMKAAEARAKTMAKGSVATPDDLRQAFIDAGVLTNEVERPRGPFEDLASSIGIEPPPVITREGGQRRGRGDVPPGDFGGPGGPNDVQPPPPGGGGFGEVTGPVHVIIAGQTQPVQITMAGGVPGAGAGATPGQMGIASGRGASWKLADLGAQTSPEFQDEFRRIVQDLTKRGMKAKEVKETANKAGLGIAASMYYGTQPKTPPKFPGAGDKPQYREPAGPPEFGPGFDVQRDDFSVRTTARQRAMQAEEAAARRAEAQAARDQERLRKASLRGVREYNRAFVPPISREERQAQLEKAFPPPKENESPFQVIPNIRVVTSPQQRAAEQAAREQKAADRAREADLKRQRRLSRTNDPLGFAGFQDVEDQEQRELRGKLRTLNRRIPRRGFGASLTDLITSAVPGSGALEQQLEAGDLAAREATEISQASTKRAQLRTQLRSTRDQRRAITPGQILSAPAEERQGLLARRRALQEQEATLRRDIGKQSEVIRISTERFNAFHKEATNATVVMKSFGAAAIGSIGSIGVGAVTFGIGSAVAAPIINAVAEGVAQGIGPAIERATGFGATTRRITAEGAQEIRARGGDTGAVAGQAARTGISAQAFARIGGPITDRAEIEAGNLALREQIDLLHASENLREQEAKAGRTGQIPGITSGTGGQFGTPLFGIPGVQEQLSNELLARPEPQLVEAAQQNLVDPESINPRLRGFAAKAGQIQTSLSPDRLIEQFDKSAERLEFFNSAAEKGGESLLKLAPATEAQADASAKLAEDVGLFDLAAKLRSTDTQVTGATSGTDIQKFLAAINRGATTPDVQLLLQDTERQRRAQVETRAVNTEFRTGTLIPQEVALAGIQRPFTDASAGIKFSSADSASTRKQINADLEITQNLYNGINKEIDLGITMAKDFVTYGADIAGFGENVGGLGVEAGEKFATALDNVRRIGKDIADIEIGLQTKQAAYQAAQFSYQINIAKRSLADAKALAGQLTDAGKDNLGVLEREQFFLQRRAQAMQLELNQKQINFQRAIAGFTAPGLTGEERAARIEQAKIEADFAQKQLNIQKELFGIEGRKFDITSARQVQDLAGQLDLLERGRVITLETAAAEKRIKALTAIQEKETKKVQALYEAAIESTNDIIKQTGELAAATGKHMGELANDVIQAYAKVLTSIINQANAGTSGYDSRDSRRATSSTGRHAGGNVMRGSTYEVNEQAQEFFTPGENGTITPESVMNTVTPMAGSSNQAAPITILITGNKFNTEEEMKKLEARITDAVNRAQSRQISLLGGRTY